MAKEWRILTFPFLLPLLKRQKEFPRGIGKIYANEFGVNCKLFGTQLDGMADNNLILELSFREGTGVGAFAVVWASAFWLPSVQREVSGVRNRRLTTESRLNFQASKNVKV